MRCPVSERGVRGAGDHRQRLHPADLVVVLMDARDQEAIPGEYDWGPGLTSPGLEDAPPSQGGRYRGRTPKMGDDPGLRALADRLAEFAGS